MRRFDLTRIPLVKPLLTSRWPQFLATTLALVGFILAIVSGWFGTPVGNHNFSIVFVWIVWWAFLMLMAVPFLGRGWCSICPIPVPGEWLQRGSILSPRKRGGFSLGRRWPNKLRNIWIQNGSFVLVALFSAVVLTQPRISAIVLATFLLVAMALSVIFERRAFCRYLCPVGGFIGIYAQVAPIEVRVKDPKVCSAHAEKSCYLGSEQGYGCPWQVFPGGLVKNTYCGMCMECLRTCPLDNVAINVRPPGTDLSHPRGRSLDEAYKAFIMLGSALVYAAVLLGPWGGLKLTAYAVGSASWWGYAVVFLTLILGVIPGLFLLSVIIGRRLSRSSLHLRREFVNFSYALVPLGLTAWIAFSLSFVLANLSYIWPVLSDPFGWGWDLFGTASASWTPYLTRTVGVLQVIVLLGGLLWSASTVRKIGTEKAPARPAMWRSLPVVGFCLVFTLSMLGLLVA